MTIETAHWMYHHDFGVSDTWLTRMVCRFRSGDSTPTLHRRTDSALGDNVRWDAFAQSLLIVKRD